MVVAYSARIGPCIRRCLISSPLVSERESSEQEDNLISMMERELTALAANYPPNQVR